MSSTRKPSTLRRLVGLMGQHAPLVAGALACAVVVTVSPAAASEAARAERLSHSRVPMVSRKACAPVVGWRRTAERMRSSISGIR